MRSRFVLVGLLALSLAACGSNTDNPTSKTTTSAAHNVPATQAEQFIPATVRLPTPSGKGVGVLLLSDIGKNAAAEAKRLAGLGIATLIVNMPATSPGSPTSFERLVGKADAALGSLRKQPGIDPARIGVIGEGVGAQVAAVAIGRSPRSAHAAVLADIGGAVVARKYAPERWLRRATGTLIHLQRDNGLSQAELKRLVLAAPPGTLVDEYDRLGPAAEAARADWIKGALLG